MKSEQNTKKGKHNKHGGGEQKTLGMKNELYVLRAAKTELEKELVLTRTMCHELQATTKAREDKLTQLERVLLRPKKKHGDKDGGGNDGDNNVPRLLLQAHRQIERLHKVLHEKQLELHSYAAMSEGGTADITHRLETEMAIDEYFTEIQRLTIELNKCKTKRNTERDQLQKRLTTQIKAGDKVSCFVFIGCSM